MTKLKMFTTLLCKLILLIVMSVQSHFAFSESWFRNGPNVNAMTRNQLEACIYSGERHFGTYKTSFKVHSKSYYPPKALCTVSWDLPKVQDVQYDITHIYCQEPYFWSSEHLACIAVCPPDKPNLSLRKVCTASVPPKECTLGNPVIISTGEKIQVEPPEYFASLPLPLKFQRVYRSQRAPESKYLTTQAILKKPDSNWKVHYQTAISPYTDSMSPKEVFSRMEKEADGNPPRAGYKQWTHSLQYHLVFDEHKTMALMIRPDGQNKLFRGSPYGNNSVFYSTTGNRDVLELHSKGTWLYKPSDTTTEEYSSDGVLNKITLNDNVFQVFSYQEDGLLSSVTHSLGGVISFSYNNSVLTEVSFPDQSKLILSYDDLNNLTAAVKRYSNGTITTRSYKYSDARNPFSLTALSIEGNVHATWQYDETGRATQSKHFADIDKTTFDYTDEFAIKVTNPLGKISIYKYENIAHAKRLIKIEGIQSDNCSSANKEISYDNRGLVNRLTDWNGQITQYTKDYLGRETQRVEAYGTPEARTISTLWNTALNKPAQITYPDRKEIYTYNEQGLLIKTEHLPLNP